MNQHTRSALGIRLRTWREDGSILICLGLGLLIWSLFRDSLLETVLDGVLWALPCFVFGFGQRKSFQLRQEREDASDGSAGGDR